MTEVTDSLCATVAARADELASGIKRHRPITIRRLIHLSETCRAQQRPRQPRTPLGQRRRVGGQAPIAKRLVHYPVNVGQIVRRQGPHHQPLSFQVQSRRLRFVNPLSDRYQAAAAPLP